MKVLYTAEAHVDGGRQGHAASSDGLLSVDLGTPPEMGGKTGGTNPEQMFAAGYGACFLGAVEVAAKRLKIEIEPNTLTADVTCSLGALTGGAYGLAVELIIGIPGIDRERTQAVLEEAHKTCPYSNATRGNIDVTLTALDG
jgi:osmotically inducible protein OsmC